MNMLSWIIFGMMVGIIVNSIKPSPNRGGMIGSILLGIVGALIGGFIANLLLGLTMRGFNITAFFIAVVGSLLLLSFGKATKSAQQNTH